MKDKVCPVSGEKLNRVIVGNLIDFHHSTGSNLTPCYHWLGHNCTITTNAVTTRGYDLAV